MTQKLKYKKSTGFYRLNLTLPELELLAGLVYSVRLGNGIDTYRDAAFNLCETFGSYEGADIDSTDTDEFMNISVTPATESEGFTIEVSEKTYEPKCPNCNGCDCQ